MDELTTMSHVGFFFCFWVLCFAVERRGGVLRGGPERGGIKSDQRVEIFFFFFFFFF